MKKKVMALVVCMILSVMMVTPCFAATSDPVYEDDEMKRINDYYASQRTQTTTVAQPTTVAPTVTQPTVATPVATSPAVATPVVTADANTQAIAMQVTYNFVVQQFYGGDHQKAFNDLTNYVNLVNACYPNVLQVMQTLNANAAQ
ncbi:MAG: hypothetical protein E7298_08455 [Lachnospiraceae bacterium]|nr:hypothetical protein [Lachnospiraceae bacterium]